MSQTFKISLKNGTTEFTKWIKTKKIHGIDFVSHEDRDIPFTFVISEYSAGTNTRYGRSYDNAQQ
jgi:hypothetical protein